MNRLHLLACYSLSLAFRDLFDLLRIQMSSYLWNPAGVKLIFSYDPSLLSYSVIFQGGFQVTEFHVFPNCVLVEARQRRNLSLIHISEPTRLGMISYAV